MLLVGVALPASSPATPRRDLPVTVILSHPGRVSYSAKATFVFYSNSRYVHSYLCSLDRGVYRSCNPMKIYYRLKKGTHRFAVKSVTAWGNGPAKRFKWVVKARPKRTVRPTVSINSHPSLTTVSTSATFSFASNKSNASFICAIDKQASTADTSYSYCESPVTYADLAPGYHSFTVIAAAGGRNSRAQTYSWNVAAVAPVNTALPVITGIVQVGKTLTASNGTWTGSLPISYTYQWQFCSSGVVYARSTTDTSQLISCGDIFGATSSSYTVQDASTLYFDSLGLSAKIARDTGANYTLRVVVTATNAAGQAKAVSSNVLSAAPVNTALPTIYVSSSEAYVEYYGDWLSFDPLYEWSFQWLLCNASGDNCSAISGATSSFYDLQYPDDVGSTLRVTVTATNNGGSGSATTLPSDVIT